MTYTEHAIERAKSALHAFETLIDGLQWTQADLEEHARLTARLEIIGAFYKALK